MTTRRRRYAAIDIGTVTCRMLVADIDEQGRVFDLDKEYEITNLGEGVDATGRLLPEAIERVRVAISRYLEVRAAFDTLENPVQKTIVMATSAARDAENSSEFEKMLHEQGLAIEVIPGTREATLSFVGATSELVPGTPAMVVDVGGGSTEIAIGRAGEAPELMHSFQIGCRRVTERFLHSDPPTEEELQTARKWIFDQLTNWKQESQLSYSPSMIAVAGTATSAVSIRERMEVYDTTRVHNAKVSAEELDDIFRTLAARPLAERRETIGLDPHRAPVIVAGMLILREVMHAFDEPTFTVSESDILHGMIIAENCQR